MAQRSTNTEPSATKGGGAVATAAQTVTASDAGDPFEAAATRYHRQVRRAVRALACKQGEIWQEFYRTLFAAYESPPSGRVEEVLRAAHDAYSKDLQSAGEAATQAFEGAYRRFLEDVRRAWASSDAGELTPEAVVAAAEQMHFIATAAQGHYPIEWWNLDDPADAPAD